ncbi:MAG: hypothetical protein HY355_03895, partial [Armatimonadetes bacterium]|nr:hypothetical protein [Armatimonadota bacterium]
MNTRKLLLAVAAIIALGAVGAGAWMLTAGTRRASAVAARVNGEAIYWSEVDVEILRAARQF